MVNLIIGYGIILVAFAMAGVIKYHRPFDMVVEFVLVFIGIVIAHGKEFNEEDKKYKKQPPE